MKLMSAKLSGAALALFALIAAAQMSHGPSVEMKGVKAQKKHEALLGGFFTPINGKLKMRATEVEIEPNGSIGDHLHFGPGIRHLIAGELTLTPPDTGKEQQVRAGEYFYESGDRDFPAQNRGTVPARLVIVELVPADLEGPAMVPLSRRPDLEKQGQQLKDAICATSSK
ncbi:MAG TPA: cupin domain-containing protein [Terriglobales bacterium]|jgi:quercetin dioxygenase-like cupin family protein|nr:cupin domain-containing protein [Terriglobales bacterium]